MRCPARSSRFGRAPPLALACAALLVAAPVAPAQDSDYWICTYSGVFKVNRTTLKVRFVTSGVGSPYYSQWWNGALIVPDYENDRVWTVQTDGTTTLLASGGAVDNPITAAVSPSNELWVTNIDSDTVMTIDAAGNQTIRMDPASYPWINTPSGMSFLPDGTLYLGQYEAGDVWHFDPATGIATIVTDGDGVMDECAAIHADNSGNIFCADFGLGQVVRVRVEDGSCVVVSNDPILQEVTDLRVTKEGTILTTSQPNSALVEVQMDGTTTVVLQPTALGPLQGISVPKDFPYSTGSVVKYGSGLAGSGGFVPDLRGILSPTIGGVVGLEHRFALGGTFGFTLFGGAPATIPVWGGTLLVDWSQPFGLLPLSFGGSGAGAGESVAFDTLPNDPTLIGATFFLQDLVVDPGAPKKVALSNGIEFTIGS